MKRERIDVSGYIGVGSREFLPISEEVYSDLEAGEYITIETDRGIVLQKMECTQKSTLKATPIMDSLKVEIAVAETADMEYTEDDVESMVEASDGLSIADIKECMVYAYILKIGTFDSCAADCRSLKGLAKDETLTDGRPKQPVMPQDVTCPAPTLNALRESLLG